MKLRGLFAGTLLLSLTGIVVRAQLREEVPRAADGTAASEPEDRVIVLAIDGADWRVIDRLIAESKCPNFKRLRMEGANGDLKSYVPLKSPVIWTTIATGVAPRVHNVLDFVYPYSAGGAKDPVPQGARLAPALWNIASAAGIANATIGYFATWPAEPVEGFMISDLAFNKDGDVWEDRCCFPDGLISEREFDYPWKPRTQRSVTELRRFLPFDFRPDWKKEELDAADREAHFLVDERLDVVYPRDEAARRWSLHLIDHDRPRFSIAYFRGIDYTGHAFWKYYEPEPGEKPYAIAPFAANVSRLQAVVPRYYEYVDEILGDFLARVDERTTLVVCSDHGFQAGVGHLAYKGETSYLSGVHREHGIFAALGRHVRPGAKLSGAAIYDVAPTLLRLLDLPLADDMPGRPIDLFSEEFERAYPANSRPTYGRRRPEIVSLSDHSRSADAIEDLKSLGYVEGSTEAAAGSAATGAPPDAEMMRWVLWGEATFLRERKGVEAARAMLEAELEQCGDEALREFIQQELQWLKK